MDGRFRLQSGRTGDAGAGKWRCAVSRGGFALSNPRSTAFYNDLRARSAAFARTQLRRLLPQDCALCAAPVPDALVCAACTAALPTIHPACPRCALPSPGGAVCGACLAHPPPFTATLAAHTYAFPVDRLLQALKYGGRIALGEWAGETLAARVRRDGPDLARASVAPLLVPLPLAAARQRQRGFNQAQLIAQALARELALPLAAALERTRAGPPQAALPWQARLGNVRGAFVARGRLDGLAVVLVDDVMTTGATLAAAAAAVLAAGARRVDCWVVARTLPPGQS
jgi:ComF family protein